jgi:hypothetical protein
MQVEWNNPADPLKGFKYLYLSEADYQSIVERASSLALKAKSMTVKGESLCAEV